MIKKIRQIHFYLGVFFAPAIVFFSLTGALQTFGLHEGTGAGAAQPLIAKLAAVHKDQSLAHSGPPPAKAGSKPSKPEEKAPESRGPSPLPLKIFVLFMSLGLISSTGTGVYMAFQYKRDRKTIWGLLVVGTILPLLLLLI